MTNPTCQQIINAHGALNRLTRLAGNYLSSTSDEDDVAGQLRQFVLRALPPKPQPTMAEVEWDDELHHLAEAEHDAIGKVIMMHPASDAEIECLHEWYGLYRVYWLSSDQLTPTGKRYTLTEVQE
ncbi:hypothetical protein [Corynebacterium sp.]|uniref:hypothetical protein n=1 Tax=Corynebacterium sp. TaxID=1720 RepID=UPI0029155762|nr:hypothetical protein [Corynebacterium sp.]MDU7512178.1 hypothetical protein [Corynebacterium sp.]MDU7565329.1 hypothetical protein [Corynebacterium sp.]